jgi:hypothetical protein
MGPTCATLRCAAGYRCVMRGAVGACVADGDHGYGTFCGGIAAIQCDAGFTCVLDARTPDSGGVCHPLSGEGGPCGGGSTRFPAVCGSGLTCQGPAAGAPSGALGTCVRATPTCATVRCASGYRCVMVSGAARCVTN